MPAVSWIMTVRNGMPYLRETLASIAAQTCTDFEVVALVMPGTDGTENELASWIGPRLPGRILIRAQIPLGAARAELVREARGEFCACIDADDVSEPTRLERQVAFLRTHPAVAAVGSDLRVIDPAGRPTGASFGAVQDATDIVHHLLSANCLGHSSVLLRRAAVLAAGNYRADISMAEDYDLWLRLAVKHPLANLPEMLVRYRSHADSFTRQLDTQRAADCAAAVFAGHAAELYGLEPGLARRLRDRDIRFLLPIALQVARHLARLHGGTPWQRLRRPSLLDSLRRVMRYHDFATRLAFDALDPRPRRLRATLRELAGKTLNRVPFVRPADDLRPRSS